MDPSPDVISWSLHVTTTVLLWHVQTFLGIICRRGITYLMPIGRYRDVIMGAMASQITCLPIVYSTIYSGVDQRKHQSSASLAFVQGIHRWPVNSSTNGQYSVTRKMFPFDDVIMEISEKQWAQSVLYLLLITKWCTHLALLTWIKSNLSMYK